MSFRKEICVYCLRNPSTPTGDHIFARKFFLIDKRERLPKAPACKQCGNEKSKLESYLMGILPFGGQHADALTNLTMMVPPRLAQNKRLHRDLYVGQSKVLAQQPSGLIIRSMALPIDVTKLESLFVYVVKGLLWHHWKVTLDNDCFVDARLPFLAERTHYRRLLNMNAAQRVRQNLGYGTFEYVGAQAVDNPQISVWEFLIYGGLRISGGKEPSQIVSTICAMSGPLDVEKRAEQRLRSKAFILRP